MDDYIVEAIKGEDDMRKALALLSEYTHSQAIKSRRSDDTLKEELSTLRKVIMGNGEPSASLIARVEKNNVDMKLIKESLQLLTTCIIGDEEGEKVGLVDQVRQHEDVITTLKKMGWVVVATALSQLALTLLGLL